MAKTTAGQPATPDTTTTVDAPAVPDTAAPAAAKPRCWRWTGEYDLYVAATGLRVRPGDVAAGDEPPTTHPLWVADPGPATVTAGPTGPRIWTPDELRRGALREDWPATSDDPTKTDDQPTEVDQ